MTSGLTTALSISTTAISVAKLTETLLTPGYWVSCFSTAVTHAAHFIPPTSRMIFSEIGSDALVGGSGLRISDMIVQSGIGNFT
jgi:hypothetical protein